MRIFFVFIVFQICFNQIGWSQSSDTEQPIFFPKGNPACVYKKKYSPAKRLTFYPFNAAASIKLVSFRYHKNDCPVKSDSVITDSLIEIKELSKKQIDSLTDILYNNFYKRTPNYGSLTMCDFPRNAILFYDSKGKLFESILLCFHCNRHTESSENIIWGDDCTQKIEKLRQFFVLVEMYFGTNRDILSEP